MTQFKDKAQRQEDNVNAGLFELPGPPGGRHPPLQGRARPRRRRPGAAPRAGARDRAQVQRPLGRDLPRAAAAPHADAEDPRARRPGEDVEVARQHHPPVRERRGRSAPSSRPPRPTRGACAARTPATPTTATWARCTSSSPTRRGSRWVYEGCTTAGIGCLECKRALADNVIAQARADPRAQGGARRAARRASRRSSARAPGVRAPSPPRRCAR